MKTLLKVLAHVFFWVVTIFVILGGLGCVFFEESLFANALGLWMIYWGVKNAIDFIKLRKFRRGKSG